MEYNIVELIRKKRNKLTLKSDEITYLINKFAKDELPDYQMSAFLMASYLNGLDKEEASALTKAMLYSGEVLDLSGISGLKVDKHSTGGVGDKISLIIAPIVASVGVPVPMISGRGLGHSGGTLDKLESISGFNVNLDLNDYKRVLAKHNLVLIGQTEEIAPADKRMYALRDVTATVECIPLIAGSIMSKKLAEGINALVLDVKFGSGAFMKTQEEAQELAETLVSIGESFNKKTIAYLTNMDQPLGYKIGNWLEVEESIDCLKGSGPEDLMQISHLLAGTMIYLGERASSVEEGIEISKNAIESGQAFQKFIDIVEEQGGDVSLIQKPESYPKPKHSVELKSLKDGFVSKLDAFKIAIASLELGAGRKIKEDQIDPVAGIILHKKIGDRIYEDETIFTLQTNKGSSIDMARNILQDAVKVSVIGPKSPTLITHKIDKNGIIPYL